LVRKGEIEGRLDPYYHRTDFIKLREKYESIYFCFVGKLIKSWDRGDGPRDGFYTDDKENGVYFLRVNNLKENSINLTSVKFITRAVHDKTLKRSRVVSGDLIFAVSGTKENLGTVSIIPEFIYEANLNSALVRLKLDESKIDKKYFCILFGLNFVRTQIDYIGKGAAQNNLNNEEISQIKIPVFSIEKQRYIVDLFEIARASKKQKQAEAAALLASIDGYLLRELGITLPLPSEKQPFFYTRAKKIIGGRFDASFYQSSFVQVAQAIAAGLYQPSRLKDLVNFSTEIWNGKDYFVEKFPYIEISEIDLTFGEIKNANYLPIKEAPSRAKMLVRHDDLIVSTTRPTRGAIAYIKQPENEVSVASTGFAVLRKLKVLHVNKLFLLFTLKHKLTLMQMEQRSSGGNYPAITMDELGKILIPLPPLEKQTEIAEHISALRLQAKGLQQQAEAEFKSAQQTVEKMILGES
jgi:restriction endonuclease S subunit